jgi:hypothetical protein
MSETPDAPTPVAPPPDLVIPAPLEAGTSFLCGPAGTGKTYLAKAIVRQKPGTLLCATTGIASVNLGEGTTVNAALGYYDTASLIDSYTSGRLTGRLGKLWRSGVRRLLIDEVSMMDAEQLTIITRAIDELSGRGYVLDHQLADEIDEDFKTTGEGDVARRAAIKVILVGDFCQLPPVKAPWAFTSGEWPRFAANQHLLTEVKRQVDPGFIAAMAAARKGDKDTVVDYFRDRLVDTPDHHYEGMTVVATNDAADRLNQLRLDRVPHPLMYWESATWGKPRGDWKNIPTRLGLKVGALVMILANRRLAVDGLPSYLWPIDYANGDLATVVAMDPEKARVTVRLDRGAREVSVDWVTRQNTIPMEPGRKTALRAANQDHLISEDGKWETIGELTYLPLRLAYASTVHKVQGLSMDKVQVATREGMFKQPGMLYVALTRARTPEGLRLVGNVDGLRERVTVHPDLGAWL